MLKISSLRTGYLPQCTPNLLPCRIHHDGPVNASPRYWSPGVAKGWRVPCFTNQGILLSGATAGGKSKAYFRGRKLKGKEVKVPEGYQGIIVKGAAEEQEAGKNVEQQQIDIDDKDGYDEEGEEQEEQEEKVKDIQAIGSFNEVMLWSHEIMVPEDDAFVRGIGEWMDFAEAVSPPVPFLESIAEKSISRCIGQGTLNER